MAECCFFLILTIKVWHITKRTFGKNTTWTVTKTSFVTVHQTVYTERKPRINVQDKGGTTCPSLGSQSDVYCQTQEKYVKNTSEQEEFVFAKK